MTNMAPSNNHANPYYAPSTSNLCIPLTIAYTCLAHAWLLCLQPFYGKVAVVAEVEQVEPLPISSNDKKKRKSKQKTVLITGSNTGIGLETARTLSTDYGYKVILACRSKDNALRAQAEINNFIVKGNDKDNDSGKAIVLDSILDLSDFSSIQQYVKELQQKFEIIDVLINNAGRNTSGQDQGDGSLDLMFQTNYLGHFYLSKLLMEAGLLQSDGNSSSSSSSKIINVSSVMHHFSHNSLYDIDSVEYWKSRAVVGYHLDTIAETDKKSDETTTKSESSDSSTSNMPDGVYSATKLAAILHCVEWNRRYPRGVKAMAVNPGAVNSDIWRGFPNWMRRVF
ncbi:MAG: hypothetical protein SGARI_002748, partial [Bacillariaceae sp.]